MFLKGPSSILNSVCQHLASRIATFCQAARLHAVHRVRTQGLGPGQLGQKLGAGQRGLFSSSPSSLSLSQERGHWLPRVLQHFVPRAQGGREGGAPSSGTPSHSPPRLRVSADHLDGRMPPASGPPPFPLSWGPEAAWSFGILQALDIRPALFGRGGCALPPPTYAGVAEGGLPLGADLGCSPVAPATQLWLQTPVLHSAKQNCSISP